MVAESVYMSGYPTYQELRETLRYTCRMEHPTSLPPPIIMVNDRLLVHYAILNDSVGFNSGHRLMLRDGVEIGRVPCLAICADRDSPQFMLYFCDSDWKPLGIDSYISVDAAKRRAERIYPGSIPCWTEARFTEVDAERFREEEFAELRCSFCGKKPTKLWPPLSREKETPESAETAFENSPRTSLSTRSPRTDTSEFVVASGFNLPD